MCTFNLLDHIRNHEEQSVVVWLFNIGVEKYWSNDISSVKSGNDEIIVNHMEEMNLLITRKQDYMIMRKKPDEAYLQQLAEKGYQIPNFLFPEEEYETRSISELVLRDEKLLNRLKQLGNENVYFAPYGVSSLEEEIADKCGMVLVGGPSKSAQQINNKIFAREVSEKLGFTCTNGQVCDSVEQVKVVSEELLRSNKKIVIKYPTGASGKGLWVVDNIEKLSTILLVIRRICEKKGIEEQFIVEEWCEKNFDLNYQIYVGMDGKVEVFSIKEQLLNETVYVGSLLPPRLPKELYAQCIKCGNKIGELMYSQGYNGVLGVDAMITKDGVFIPIIEINARFTLSTYTSFLSFGDENKYMLSFYRRIPLNTKDDYLIISNRLKNDFCKEEGFCYVSETVKEETVGKYGRMFVVVYAGSIERVLKLHADISTM